MAMFGYGGYGHDPYYGGMPPMPPPSRRPPPPPLVAFESAPADCYRYADPYSGLVTSISIFIIIIIVYYARRQHIKYRK